MCITVGYVLFPVGASLVGKLIIWEPGGQFHSFSVIITRKQGLPEIAQSFPRVLNTYPVLVENDQLSMGVPENDRE